MGTGRPDQYPPTAATSAKVSTTPIATLRARVGCASGAVSNTCGATVGKSAGVDGGGAGFEATRAGIELRACAGSSGAPRATRQVRAAS